MQFKVSRWPLDLSLVEFSSDEATLTLRATEQDVLDEKQSFSVDVTEFQPRIQKRSIREASLAMLAKSRSAFGNIIEMFSFFMAITLIGFVIFQFDDAVLLSDTATVLACVAALLIWLNLSGSLGYLLKQNRLLLAIFVLLIIVANFTVYPIFLHIILVFKSLLLANVDVPANGVNWAALFTGAAIAALLASPGGWVAAGWAALTGGSITLAVDAANIGEQIGDSDATDAFVLLSIASLLLGISLASHNFRRLIVKRVHERLFFVVLNKTR